MNDVDLPAFMESALGVIVTGMSSNGPFHYQIVRHQHGAYDNLATLGLSNHPLASRVSGKQLRLEIFIHVPSGTPLDEYSALLGSACNLCLESHFAVLRGDVVSLQGTAMNSWAGLYFTVPIFLADELRQFSSPSLGALVLAIPIKATEVEYIQRLGWEAWEDVLDARGDEVFDPDRQAFV